MDPTDAPLDDPPPQPPEPPGEFDCCGNGCDPCVYDLYAIERERHAAALKAWQARQQARGASGETTR